jgi:hypothetical protein
VFLERPLLNASVVVLSETTYVRLRPNQLVTRVVTSLESDYVLFSTYDKTQSPVEHMGRFLRKIA